MKLILISGAEATCKSDLGQQLAKVLGYSYQTKDHIKETMYDHEKHSTWDFGWYESRAKTEFFKDISEFITADSNAIIESNFIGEDKQRLMQLVNDRVQLVEIHCHAKGLTSFKRLVQRNESGRRHPGHHDRRWYPKVFIQSLFHAMNINIGAHQSVTKGNHVYFLDTTQYPDIDFDQVLSFVKKR